MPRYWPSRRIDRGGQSLCLSSRQEPIRSRIVWVQHRDANHIGNPTPDEQPRAWIQILPSGEKSVVSFDRLGFSEKGQRDPGATSAEFTVENVDWLRRRDPQTDAPQVEHDPGHGTGEPGDRFEHKQRRWNDKKQRPRDPQGRPQTFVICRQCPS